MARCAAAGSLPGASAAAIPSTLVDSIRFRVQNIRMTNNIRVFLWLGLALAVWLNYSQWQVDYGPKPGNPSTATSAAGEPKPASLDDTVPQANQPAAPTADAPPTAAAPGTTAAAASVPAAAVVPGAVAVGGASAVGAAGWFACGTDRKSVV